MALSIWLKRNGLKRIPLMVSYLYHSGMSSKAPRIYTRTGDKGTSLTYTGERRAKNNEVFEALGATDELSCAIGLAREHLTVASKDLDIQLETIQCILQDLSSAIATPKSSARASQLKRTAFNEELIKELEQWIDIHTEKLPQLKNFILPSGGKAAASLHLSRTICRRAERRVLPLYQHAEIDDSVLRYLNRLSDYLFTVARLAAKLEGHKETVYRKIVSEQLQTKE